MSQNKVTVPTVSREEIYRFPDESFTDRMTEPIDVATLFLLGFPTSADTSTTATCCLMGA